MSDEKAIPNRYRCAVPGNRDSARCRKGEGDFRKCEIVKIFPKVAPNPDDDGILRGEIDDYGISIWGNTVRIAIRTDDIADIEKGIRLLKKCKAFWQCVNDREAGKVKHCYENDRRWR